MAFVDHGIHIFIGKGNKPIDYKVTRLRDGATIGRRIVQATQEGALVLYAMTSFCKPETSVISFQYPIPVAPPPEELKSYKQLIEEYIAR